MSRLTATLSCYWDKIQGSLFPWLLETLDPLTAKQQQLVEILELVRIEEFLPNFDRCEGRPRKTRAAIARSFVAKTLEEEVIQHAASDSTAIEAREKAAIKPELNAATDKVIRKRGRPKKGEERPTPKPTRIERQKSMSLEEMLGDLPIACDKVINFTYPEDHRYNERTVAERANARLKDEFGARKVRVRGGMKVACHLMFGVLVLAADQLIKLVN